MIGVVVLILAHRVILPNCSHRNGWRSWWHTPLHGCHTTVVPLVIRRAVSTVVVVSGILTACVRAGAVLRRTAGLPRAADVMAWMLSRCIAHCARV